MSVISFLNRLPDVLLYYYLEQPSLNTISNVLSHIYLVLCFIFLFLFLIMQIVYLIMFYDLFHILTTHPKHSQFVHVVLSYVTYLAELDQGIVGFWFRRYLFQNQKLLCRIRFHYLIKFHKDQDDRDLQNHLVNPLIWKII